uniref:Apoptosis-inducing factor 1, mitochondrial n=1 Tax=Parastrongyloides trichosuri TaxID=131310 RepID=A0A0N4ZXD8_PARTI
MIRSCSRILFKNQCIVNNNKLTKASLWTALWRDAENRAISNVNKKWFVKPIRPRRYSTGWDGKSDTNFFIDNNDNKKESRNYYPFFVAGAVICLGFYFSKDAFAQENKVEEKEEEISDDKELTNDAPSYLYNIPYLLIGGGTSSYYASLAIRSKDPNAHCLIITEEEITPYQRPPLSRDVWWYGDEETPETLSYTTLLGKKRQVSYESDGFFINPKEISEFEHGAVSIIKGKKVIKLEPENHKAILDDGTEIIYKKCLIGTGSKARELKELKKDELKNYVTTLRDVNDYRDIANKIKEGKKDFVIIGGGLLGTELTASLLKIKKDDKLNITQIFRGTGVLRKQLPQFMSDFTAMELKKMGVNVKSNTNVTDGSILEDGKVKLSLINENGEKSEIITEHVIVAIGATPNTELGAKSGFELDPVLDGICTDSGMRSTLHPDVFVAGDVSSFYDPLFGRRRVEHWEHAQITGRVAGENMAGGCKTYTHQGSWFTILAPHIHYTSVGRTDPDLETVSIFAQDAEKEHPEDKEPTQKGVIFYTENKRIVGVVLMNVFGIGVEIARRLIMDKKEIENFVEVAKLFALYPEPGSDETDTLEKSE